MNKPKFTGLLLSSIFLAACLSCSQKESAEEADQSGEVDALETIAFGSCNRQDSDQPLWDPIISHNPELFIWLGDNIYGDTDSMPLLNAKYEMQDNHPDYQKLKANTPIIGIWDDHDYGKNDAGKEYPYREESRDLMYDFLEIAADSPLRDKAGAYGSYEYGPEGKKVKVILLDARYFRDSLAMEDRVYLPNEVGTVLGDEQWKWFESEMKNNTAQLTLIGSGIQILSKEHQFEKWANFPYEREKLLNLLKQYQVEGAILMSGDRHIAEISKMDIEGISHPVYDITSSGLTHTWKSYQEEVNQYRVGDLIAKLNFGIINLDWQEEHLGVSLEVRGISDSLYLSQQFSVKLN